MSDKDNQVEEQDGKQNDAGKVKKQFEGKMKSLVALFKGESMLATVKVQSADLKELLAELTKDRKEKLFKEFKEKAEVVINRKLEFDKFEKQCYKELQEKLDAKRKEMMKDMDSVFGLVEKIQGIEKEYYDSFKDLSGVKDEKAAPTDTENPAGTAQQA